MDDPPPQTVAVARHLNRRRRGPSGGVTKFLEMSPAWKEGGSVSARVALDGLGPPRPPRTRKAAARRARRRRSPAPPTKGPAPSARRTGVDPNLDACRPRPTTPFPTDNHGAVASNRTSLLNNPCAPRHVVVALEFWVTMTRPRSAPSSPSAPADKCRARPASRRPPPATGRAPQTARQAHRSRQARQRRRRRPGPDPGYTAPRGQRLRRRLEDALDGVGRRVLAGRLRRA